MFLGRGTSTLTLSRVLIVVSHGSSWSQYLILDSLLAKQVTRPAVILVQVEVGHGVLIRHGTVFAYDVEVSRVVVLAMLTSSLAAMVLPRASPLLVIAHDRVLLGSRATLTRSVLDRNGLLTDLHFVKVGSQVLHLYRGFMRRL